MKRVIVSTPLTPFRVACQNSFTPTPLGLTTPIPLTTTLRLEALSPFPFILTPRLRNSLISFTIALGTLFVKIRRVAEAVE